MPRGGVVALSCAGEGGTHFEVQVGVLIGSAGFAVLNATGSHGGQQPGSQCQHQGAESQQTRHLCRHKGQSVNLSWRLLCRAPEDPSAQNRISEPP